MEKELAHKVVIQAVEMPAGEYWVGDPCYSVPDERWMEWLEAANFRDERRFLVADLDEHTVLGIGTAHGDGCYLGSDGHDYPVDAGLIGVTPVELVEGEPFGSRRVIFSEPFTCTYDDGMITLGSIHIATDWEDDEIYVACHECGRTDDEPECGCDELLPD